jgi:hypothetical protein
MRMWMWDDDDEWQEVAEGEREREGQGKEWNGREWKAYRIDQANRLFQIINSHLI